MSKQLLTIPDDGLNTVDPSHRIADGQCSVLQNLIPSLGKIYKFPGTQRYTPTPLINPITWAERYYGIKADGSFVKKTFCFSNGIIYAVDDVTGALTSVQEGFNTNVRPESVVIQVAENSLMFFFTGEDVPYYYDGNGANQWYKSSITYKFQQGVCWLDRLWAFEKNASTLYYSKTLFPENLTDTTDAGSIIIGNDKDSFSRRIVLLGDTLFIFKNNGIYYIEGRTPSTFAARLVTDKYGLAAKRGITKVLSALAFVNEFDKEVYSFGGTETSIKLLSREVEFSKLADHTKIENICCVEHKNLFRLSYQPSYAASDSLYNSDEICYPTQEINSRKQPKWCISHGANIGCYSVWDRQGDKNELVTGRSDTGLLMYHYRGHNWDNTAMEIRIRTKDKVYFEGRNCRFNYFIIDGSPQQDKTITLRWYLNSRLYGYTKVGSNTTLLDGEEQTIAAMNFTTQARFNKRIVPSIVYAKSNSLSLEVEDSTLNADFELYSIIVDYEISHIIRTSLVGG